MSVPQSVAEILNHHVTFQLECIDRMYLNVYVPRLQCESGIAQFFRGHRGHKFASSALMDPMTKAFVAAMEGFAKQHAIAMVQFHKGQRKDDVMEEHLARFNKPEGIVFIGKAQEKTPVFRTEKRRNPQTGQGISVPVHEDGLIFPPGLSFQEGLQQFNRLRPERADPLFSAFAEQANLEGRFQPKGARREIQRCVLTKSR